MAKREIEDQEYAFLKGRQQVADFVESIYNDPQLNREAKALIKKKYPNLNIPDYDLMTQVDQRFADEKKARDDEAKARKEAEDNERFNQTRSSIQKKYGFTDEAMTELEQFMVERNVGDYEVAASYHASQNPRPSEATFDDQRWNHSKQEGFAEIAKDPEAWGRAEIMKAITADNDRARNQRF